MKGVQRRVVVTAVVVAVAAAALWAVSALRSPDPSDEIGFDEIVLACADVRAASEVIGGPYASVAPTILDHAVLLTAHAAARNDAWAAADAAVQAFHTASHAADPAAIEAGRQAALTQCLDIPAPDRSGQ